MADSFDKAFIAGANTGAAASMEMIKERIKKNEDQRKSGVILDVITTKIVEDAIKQGKTPEEADKLAEKIQKLGKVGFTSTELMSVGKVIAPESFKDQSPVNIYTVGNNGEVTKAGEAPHGSKVFKENLSPEEIAAREGARQNVKNQAPTPEMKQASMNLESQIQSFDSAMKLLGASPQGIIEGNTAAIAGAVTGGKENTAGKLYSDILPALSSSLYKDMTGDTRLSDADAQARAYPLFPKQGDDPSVNRMKENFIRATLQRRQAQYKSGNFSPMSQAEIMDEYVKFVSDQKSGGDQTSTKSVKSSTPENKITREMAIAELNRRKKK